MHLLHYCCSDRQELVIVMNQQYEVLNYRPIHERHCNYGSTRSKTFVTNRFHSNVKMAVFNKELGKTTVSLIMLA